MQVRDSKQDNGPILQFSPQAWTAFIAAIVDGTIRPAQVKP